MKVFKMIFLSLIVFLSINSQVFSVAIEGKVRDINEINLQGIKITLASGDKIIEVTATDRTGKFKFNA